MIAIHILAIALVFIAGGVICPKISDWFYGSRP